MSLVAYRPAPISRFTAMAAEVALQVFLSCRKKETRPRLAAVSPPDGAGAAGPEGPGLTSAPRRSSSSRAVFCAAVPR